MRSILIRALMVLALASMLAGCGGGPSRSIRVVMTDFAFTPTAFTVPAGQSISAEFVNEGAATHSFVIMQAGYQVQEHFTDADKAHVYWEEASVAPGQSKKDTFQAPSQPGEYQIVCAVPGHLEAGMLAKLIVVKSP